MKVERLTIQRINVTLSCGCGVVCDFKDPLCKDPFKPVLEGKIVATAPGGSIEEKTPTSEAIKEYSICAKHKEDSNRSMLEFMMAERMDEAIAEAQRPVLRTPLAVPVETVTVTGLEGENVTKVAIQGGANRPARNPLAVKKVQRSGLAGTVTAAAVVAAKQEQMAVEMGTGASSLAALDELINGD